MMRKPKQAVQMPRVFWIVITLCLVALLGAIFVTVYYSGGTVGFQ
jgi:hypothetical protein